MQPTNFPSRHQRWLDRRHGQDDWIWRRLYTIAVWGARVLALPSALSAVLLFSDAFLLPPQPDQRLLAGWQCETTVTFQRACRVHLNPPEPDGYFPLPDGTRLPLWLEASEVIEVSPEFAAAVSPGDLVVAARTPLFGRVSRVEIQSDGTSDGTYQVYVLGMLALSGLLPLFYWRPSATDLWDGYEDSDDPDDLTPPPEPGGRPWKILVAVVTLEAAMIVPLIKLLR